MKALKEEERIILKELKNNKVYNYKEKLRFISSYNKSIYYNYICKL